MNPPSSPQAIKALKTMAKLLSLVDETMDGEAVAEVTAWLKANHIPTPSDLADMAERIERAVDWAAANPDCHTKCLMCGQDKPEDPCALVIADSVNLTAEIWLDGTHRASIHAGSRDAIQLWAQGFSFSNRCSLHWHWDMD